MNVFKKSNDKTPILTKAKERKFNNEKSIQKLVEKNLEIIFPNLEFLESEYSIERYRLDTIAVDKSRKCFVIIEYKNHKNSGVVDQGITYLNLIKDKQGDIITIYNEKKGKIVIQRKDMKHVDHRMIFISPKFTDKQINASEFESRIELYTIKQFENDTILFEKIEKNEKQSPLKSNNSKKKPKITIPEYSENDYLDGKYISPKVNKETRILYLNLKSKIFENFPQIDVEQTKAYVKFQSKKDSSIICTVVTYKNKLKIYYTTTKKIIPLSQFVLDVSKIGHYGLGNYMSEIKNEKHVNLAIPLIRKVYNEKIN